MTVPQDGSAYAFEHVDRGAAAGVTNIVPALQEARANWTVPSTPHNGLGKLFT